MAESRSCESEWLVRTTDGSYLGPLSKLEISKGLFDGWITLEDEARDPRRGWVRVKVRLHDLFEVKALQNSGKAFAQFWAPCGASVGAILGLTGYIVWMVVSVPGFGFSGASWFIVITVVGLLLIFLLCLRFPNPLTWALSLAAFGVIGGGLLYNLTGLTVDFVPHLKLAIVSFLAFGAAGYGIGYASGWLLGHRHRHLYSPPPSRSPIPDDVTVSDFDLWKREGGVS